MKESIIQSQIKKYLESGGWMVIKLIQTTLNGIPDLIALKDGITLWVEVKQPGKKPTDLQKYRHDKLRAKGFDVITASSVRDVELFFSSTMLKQAK